MENNNLIKIRELISMEVSNSFKEVGTKNMIILCNIKGLLDTLINRLENPEKYKKLDKQQESKLWRD